MVLWGDDFVYRKSGKLVYQKAYEGDNRLQFPIRALGFCLYLQRKHLEVDKTIPSFSNIKSQGNLLFNIHPLTVEQ